MYIRPPLDHFWWVLRCFRAVHRMGLICLRLGSVTAFLPCSKIEPVAIAVPPSFVTIMNQVYLDSSHMYMYILCAWIRSILNSITAFPSLHIFTLCAFCEQVSNVSSCIFLWAILVPFVPMIIRALHMIYQDPWWSLGMLLVSLHTPPCEKYWIDV